MMKILAKIELEIHSYKYAFFSIQCDSPLSNKLRCLFTEMLVQASAIDRGCNVMYSEKTQQSWCQEGGCAESMF